MVWKFNEVTEFQKVTGVECLEQEEKGEAQGRVDGWSKKKSEKKSSQKRMQKTQNCGGVKFLCDERYLLN